MELLMLNGCGRRLRGLTTVGTVLLMLAALPAAGRPDLAPLLEAMRLSDYPEGWHPPPIMAHTVEGQSISLAGLSGRLVLVNFWATWCPPCLHEMPDFQSLHERYESRGLSVLGINIQEDPAKVRRYVERLGVRYPNLLDPDGEISKAYGIVGTPSTFLIGRDGRPVALAVGERKWDGPAAHQLIEALLAENGGDSMTE